LEKVGWIMSLAREEEVDYIFDGGDLFDRAVQSPWEILQMYGALFLTPAPIFAVAGNHPIRGDAEVWKSYSGLYLLAKMLAQVKGFDNDMSPRFQLLDVQKADVRLPSSELIFRLDHSDLVRKPVIWEHTLWEDYDAGEADVVLVSHYHPFQGKEKIGGTWFVSPGAVSRGTLGEDNVERIPKVAIIECTKKKVTNIRFVDIPCAPGDEVLDLSTVLTTEDIQKDQENYDASISTLRAMAELNEATISPEEILKTLAKMHNIGKLVLTYVLDKLEELRK
jgi:DNA repair exonuclease SbcCD nuclease subunit